MEEFIGASDEDQESTMYSSSIMEIEDDFQDFLGSKNEIQGSIKEDFEPHSNRGKVKREFGESDKLLPTRLSETPDVAIYSRKRKMMPTWTKKVQVRNESGMEAALDDGYSWRKYGQKDILGAKYPRGYYRCTHRHTRGCAATKQVQRNDEDPCRYDIIYKGEHTCILIPRSNSELSGRQSLMDERTDRLIYGPNKSKHLLYDQKNTNSNSSEISHVDVIKEEGSIISSTTTLSESDQPVYADFADFADLLFGANDSTVDPIVIKGAKGDSIPCVTRNLGGCWSEVDPSVIINCNFQRLLSAFKEVEVKKIGIFGIGGLGKTTVMENFFACYALKRLFELVLWVTIPRCYPRRKIQNALLQQLSLDVPNIKSDDEVAMILHKTLLARKFVLFLDDVWEYMDLPKVGIPVGNLDKGSVIILATRSIHICEAMEVDKIIEAQGLSREESLQLFRYHVGHVMDSQDIEHYGRAIVDECSGLPLTIKVVGKTLKMDSSIHIWKHALKEILLTNNLHVLKLGYDRLKEDDMRSCFLFSALFTQSKAFRISSLVEYLVDEGLVALNGLSDALKRGHDIIEHLIDVSLLECTDGGLMVDMHDPLCDLALVILSGVEGLQMLLSRYFRSLQSQEPLLFDMSNLTLEQPERTEREDFSPPRVPLSILKAGEGLFEPPSEDEWEEAKMVFLMDNNISSLPTKPVCSKLLILFLQRNYSLRAIPPSFFEHLSILQILNLSKTRIKSLPHSLSKLQRLQVLILRNCERLQFLPSDIGTLKHLLVLDVHGTDICQLPDQIGELLCLVHLQVCFYGSMDQDERAMLPSQLISKGVISSCSHLRELSIIVYPGDPRWTKIASDVTIEVSNLKLCSLSFHFPEIKYLEYFINVSSAWLHRTLTRFNFIVGHDVKHVVSHVSDELEHEYTQQDQCLRFVNGEDIPDAIGKVLSKATAFYLDHHLTAHSLTQFGWAAINVLKFCIVRECPKLKAIINSIKSTANCFPVLELLSIHYSWSLSQIWVGPIRAGCLSMLRRLSVHTCPKVEFIFSRAMVAVLPNLEELIVVDCQSMKNVISNQGQISADDNIGDSDMADLNVAESSSMQDDEEHLMELDPLDVADLKIKVLKLHYLPKLVNIWNGGDLPCVEYVSIYNCPRLKKLNLKSVVEFTIKEIKTETGWWDDLEWDDPALPAKLQDRVKQIQCDDI